MKRHIKLLIIVPIVFGIAGFSVSKWLFVPQYESSAILIVNASPNMQASGITYDQITTAQQLVNTYSIILKSDTVLNMVIGSLNLNTNAKQLADNITVNGINQTEVIKLVARNPDPQTAADIANKIIQVAPQEIIKMVKAGSVEIISPAKKSESPVSPKIWLNTVIFVLFGLIISLFILLFIEMMNNTFSSSEDITKYLGCSVIGVIPKIKLKVKS
jgi:capsular polysaccharide biosynthesis protein